jgi:prolyl-tRNA editing enzyme YbaK/EbsC (Cys-tRNA(Pro) deacylase)
VRSSVDVHNFLVEREVPHEVFAARGRLRSPDRIASVLDLPPGDVGRVVVYEGPGGPVAAVVPASREPDPDRLRKAARRRRLEAASDDRTSALTEFLPESTPPAGLPEGFSVVVDGSFDLESVLYFPGGEPRAVLKIRGHDLVEATGATVADIASSDNHRRTMRRG